MKTRKKFTREFKISILCELENGKNSAQISRENSIHPTMLSKWKREYKENPETASVEMAKSANRKQIGRDRTTNRSVICLKCISKKSIEQLRGQAARTSKTERKELIYMKIRNMHKEPNQISIIRGCSALGISRSGYNKWIRQKQTHYSDPEEMKFKNEIHAIALDFPRYGYRRITIELHRRGFEVNHKVVYEYEDRQPAMPKKAICSKDN